MPTDMVKVSIGDIHAHRHGQGIGEIHSHRHGQGLGEIHAHRHGQGIGEIHSHRHGQGIGEILMYPARIPLKETQARLRGRQRLRLPTRARSTSQPANGSRGERTLS